MSLEHARSGDWVVFLDDDVALPKDWLATLGAAAALYPDAGVWGARVRDFSRPSHIQSADVFLEPLPGGGQQLRRFSLSSCHHQTLDRGQFTYVRPCATVTGVLPSFQDSHALGQRRVRPALFPVPIRRSGPRHPLAARGQNARVPRPSGRGPFQVHGQPRRPGTGSIRGRLGQPVQAPPQVRAGRFRQGRTDRGPGRLERRPGQVAGRHGSLSAAGHPPLCFHLRKNYKRQMHPMPIS